MDARHQIETQKLEEDNRKKKDRKRARRIIVRKDKLIGKNDIITDPAAKKIKLEPEKHSIAVIKLDLERELDNREGGDQPATATVDDVHSEAMESEEGTEFVAVSLEEKVDLSDDSSDETSSLLSSLRNVTSTIEKLQKEKKELKTLLNERDAENRNLNTQLGQRDTENNTLEQKLEQRDIEIEKLTRTLEETNTENRNLNVKWEQKNVGIENLKALVNVRNVKIRDLNTQLHHRNLENKMFAEQKTKAEADLESEIKTGEKMKEILLEKDEELESQNNIIRSQRLQLEKMTELLLEKSAEVTSQTKIADGLRSQIAKMKELSDCRKVVQTRNMKDGESSSDHHLDNNTTGDGNCVSSEEKVMQLFQDVLKVFIQHQEIGYDLVDWADTTPMLKTCRLVCKSWKQSVGFILEGDSSHITLFGIRNQVDRFDKTLSPLPLLFSGNNSEDPNPSFLDLGNFLEESDRMGSAYNPLPTRHVMIWHGHDPAIGWDLDDISKRAIEYLKQFGKHVWHLTVDIDVENMSRLSPPVELTVHQRLREMLELLPNLRSLAIRIRCDLRLKGSNSKLGQVSFPHLKHLETFQCYTNADLFYSILEQNQHIKRLAFAEEFIPYGTTHSLFQKNKFNFQNLSEMTCYVKRGSWKKFLNASVNVESLSLWFDDTKIHLADNIFQGLENIGKTLKFLAIDLRHVQIKKVEDWKVNLPQLTSLHVINADWEPMNWDGFFVQLENLEKFTLEQLQEANPTVSQKKSFLEYINTFHKKDGWLKLCKLKRVNVTVHIGDEEIGKPFRVWVKRSKSNVLRFDLVSIDEKELA